VQSIYLGGGTPTVLSMEDMYRLFDLLGQMYISPATVEITVEAGRPDTLNLAKMQQLKKLGVDRVCINPQTMNNATLMQIGRNHDMEGVMRSVGWAREAGIKNINTDLIVGLPGESLRENTYTAEKILLLQPENITVHTLAVKRGSQMAGSEKGKYNYKRMKEVQQGVDYFSDIFRVTGYLPYYLYRQKYMQASLENVGYSLKGHFCLYNIQMIEERQTIIGLGGGGASKFINPMDWSLSSHYNPRNPESYCQTVDALVRRKVDKLIALF
jgi:oxygen-independent coproporphyrinogen-3 oxidase